MSAARKRQDAPIPQFEGRVKKWERRFLPQVVGKINNEVRLEVMKWVKTEVSSTALTGPRHPHLRPAKGPNDRGVTIFPFNPANQTAPTVDTMQVETGTTTSVVMVTQHPTPTTTNISLL